MYHQLTWYVFSCGWCLKKPYITALCHIRYTGWSKSYLIYPIPYLVKKIQISWTSTHLLVRSALKLSKSSRTFSLKKFWITLYTSYLIRSLHEHQTTHNRMLHSKLYPELWRSTRRPQSATYIARARNFSSFTRFVGDSVSSQRCIFMTQKNGVEKGVSRKYPSKCSPQLT